MTAEPFMGAIDIPGAPRLHVDIEGRGRPVVLSHALGLDSGMWTSFAKRLAEGALGASCEVLRYDHRGHGRSEIPNGPYLMDQLVDDAARVIREWDRGPVTWIGLSMGAMVGQGLAMRYPDLVSSLVLANTTSRYPAAAIESWQKRIEVVRSQGMAAVADMVTERYLHAAFRAAHAEETSALRETIHRNDPNGYCAACHAVAHVDWLDRLAEIQRPTLVIAGALDAGAPPAMGQAIADRIDGARFVVIANASHLSVLESPDRFESAVGELLSASC